MDVLIFSHFGCCIARKLSITDGAVFAVGGWLFSHVSRCPSSLSGCKPEGNRRRISVYCRDPPRRPVLVGDREVG